jgi:hypothetical protein
MAISRSASLPGRLDVSDFWPRMPAAARIVFEEFHRSRAAERRYDDLRTRLAAAWPDGGRGGKARQVFNEIYASANVWRVNHPEATCQPNTTNTCRIGDVPRRIGFTT